MKSSDHQVIKQIEEFNGPALYLLKDNSILPYPNQMPADSKSSTERTEREILTWMDQNKESLVTMLGPHNSQSYLNGEMGVLILALLENEHRYRTTVRPSLVKAAKAISSEGESMVRC